MDSTEAEALLPSVFQELEGAALGSLVEDGFRENEIRIQHFIDARYAGQSFELRVRRDGWVEAFHTAHEERYGYARRDTPVEAVTVRVIAEAPSIDVPEHEVSGTSTAEYGTTIVRGSEGTTEAKLVDRSTLGIGTSVEGPAVIQEYSATTWVPGGWVATVHASGSLILTESESE